MTNEEFARRSNIINKAITALQKRVNVEIYAKEIKVDSIDDDKINIDFVYVDSLARPDKEPSKTSIAWGFEGYWFDTEEGLEMKHGQVWGNDGQWQETEDHIPSAYNIPEDDKAALRIAYQYYRALKRCGPKYVK